MTRQKVKKVIASSNLNAQPYYPSIAEAQRWTEVLNHIMYGGAVPKYRKIEIRRLRNAFAWCVGKETKKLKKKYCELIINEKFDSFASFYTVLAHELVHASEYMQTGDINHGKFFYSHKQMLGKIGIKLQETH